MEWTYQILRDDLSKFETFGLALGLLSQLAKLCEVMVDELWCS